MRLAVKKRISVKVTITSTTPTTTKPRAMANSKTKMKTIPRVKTTTMRRAMAR